MKATLHFVLVFMLFGSVKAQNTTISPSVFSPPRQSYDAILSIPSPQTGDMVYDTTFNCLRVYTAGKWNCSYKQPGDLTPNISGFAFINGTGQSIGYGIALDDSSNVYVTGFFKGNATFDTITISSGNGTDSTGMFIAKYGKNSRVKWVKMAKANATISGSQLTLDKNGNIYIVGTYGGNASFGTATVTSLGGHDIFIAKYTNNGQFQWVRSAGSNSTTGYDYSRSIVADSQGNVYLTGNYYTTATFETSTITSSGQSDFFLAKYDTNGNLLWVKSGGGAGNDYGHGITLDSNENVYIVGSFDGTTNIGGNSIISSGYRDIFFARYSPNGIMGLLQFAGGAGDDVGYNIQVDGNYIIYISGSFSGTVSFGNPVFGPISKPVSGIVSKSSSGENDIFIAKYDMANYLLSWVQTAGGAKSEHTYRMKLDTTGNIYIAGIFMNTVKFGSISKISSGAFDAFVAKCSSIGEFEWVQSIGGKLSDEAYGVDVSKNGNVFVTGTYSGKAAFGSTFYSTSGYNNFYVIKLDSEF
ncbi:hypothetical protein GVN20_24540 [Runella sp. CRIBMP]|uniref:SBBP repeat-containing protein n=1 Tax=Runella sp. CRIBMP TaxID=2683261 RepID=UPI0014133B04|nr:SBBP repeat-containing protein [Runella sp. CRIBMP]NBB22545.1 hypothetical protein [Runella sp. CRIBMP]